MKLEEIRQAYLDYTGKVSEILRPLLLGGIAIIWVLRVGKEDAGGIKFDSALLWPLAFFVFALAFDLLQYVYYSLAWDFLNRKYWNKYHNNQQEVRVSQRIHWAGNTFFWGKVIACFLAYVFLFSHIVRQLADN